MAGVETRAFDDGEIIFREGEESDAAYVIEQGRVELLKSARGGLARLAMLAVGDLFGEVGVLDRGPRTSTARAAGPLLLTVIPRDEFIRLMQSDPQAALKVMTRMARRQRDIDTRLAGAETEMLPLASGTALVSGPAGAGAGAGGGVTGGGAGSGGGGGFAGSGPSLRLPQSPAPPRPATLLGRIAEVILPGVTTAVQSRRAVAAAAQVARRPRQVVVTPLSAEAEYDQRPYLIEALAGIARVSVRPTGEAVAGMIAAGEPARGRTAARQLLRDEKADLVVWGGEDESGRVILLRFAAAHVVDLDRPGMFPPDSVLVIPGDFDGAWHPLIRAVVLVALGELHESLPTLAEQAQGLGLAPPDTMTAEEQAAVIACFGHVAVAAAMRSGRVDLVGWAMDAYRRALAILPAEAATTRARLLRCLGLLIQNHAEATNALPQWEEAARCYGGALAAITVHDDPRAWGALNVRLGQVMFRIALASGDDRALKDAIAHYQQALRVITRSDDPWRWADVMTALAQVVQVYGDHLKSVDILRKAADICRSALEIRTSDVVPLLYAATRNNQATALFLLAKLSEDIEAARAAAEGFRDALVIYRAGGGTGKLYRTLEKNLTRAEDLLVRYEGRSVARPAWAAEPEAPAAARQEGAAPGADPTIVIDPTDRI